VARLTTGALALLLVVALTLRRHSPQLGAADLGHLAVLGVVSNVAPFFLFAWGEERVSSGLAGVSNATTPLFTVALAIAVLPDERPTRARMVGLVTGFLGAVVILAPWRPGATFGTLGGELACLGAAACYGVGFVYTRRFLSGRALTPLSLAAGQVAAAAIVMGLLAPAVAIGPVHLTARVVAAVVVLGAVNTGLAYLLYHALVREAGATGSSMVTYLIPVVAVVLGVVALGEQAGWNLIVGGAVVIGGVALTEGRLTGRLRRRRHHPSVPESSRPVEPGPPRADRLRRS
jgi:drug/metabolite transporter (DMT)-like permease